MKKRLSVFVLSIFGYWLFAISFLPIANRQSPIATCHAAPIGTWKNYLAYSDITQIEKGGNTIYVLASEGLYSYNTNDQSIQTYDKTNGLSDSGISFISWNNAAKKLVIIYSNNNIDLMDNSGQIENISDYYNKSMTVDKTIYGIDMNGIYAYISTGFGIIKLNVKQTEISDSYNLGFRVNYSYIEGNYIYAASPSNGLYRALLTDNLLDKNNWRRVGGYVARNKTIDPELLTIAQTLSPGGPKYNYFGFLKFTNDALYSCNGGDWNQHKPGCIQVLRDDEWSTIVGTEDITKKTGVTFRDIMCLDVDPNDNNHIIAGARNGVYEFTNGLLTNFYNDENSPIESAINPIAKEYELITGILFDNNNNIWTLNSRCPNQSLLKLTNERKWESYPHSELMIHNGKSGGKLEDMFWDSRGLIWFVNNEWINASAICYNPNTDTILRYGDFTNQDGTSYTVYYVKCISEDRDGNIWFGTDKGLFYLTAEDIQNGNTSYVNQYKVPRNDGTNYADYLLVNVNITSIAIDAANRKWIGTDGNGIYLISADNNTQEHHFLTSNSELISNNIESIAVNSNTGEVFFGTDHGLCSYMSDATATNESMSKDNVYAYPNPVKPDYTGLITITGLSFNADVKITTSNGVLVAEGKSTGGSFTWDGTDLKGKRVASGIYLVQTATEGGGSGTVCKIAIIR